MAGILHNFGYTVEFTRQTADGGRDIIAILHSQSRFRCLIECKRYSESNKVGITAVQRLHGVVQSENANKGLLVTTSSFTKPARRFMAKTPWLLEGQDLDGIVKWLKENDKAEMLRVAEQKFDFMRIVLGEGPLDKQIFVHFAASVAFT